MLPFGRWSMKNLLPHVGVPIGIEVVCWGYRYAPMDIPIPQIQLVEVEKLCSQSHKRLSFPQIHKHPHKHTHTCGEIVMKMLSLISRALLITLGVWVWRFSTEMMLLLSHLASTKRSLSVNISWLSLLQIIVPAYSDANDKWRENRRKIAGKWRLAGHANNMWSVESWLVRLLGGWFA